MAGKVRPDDLVLVNRAGTDYQTEAKNLKRGVCELDELPGPPPWVGNDDGASVFFHIKNVSDTLQLTGGPFTAWDVDGTKEREINEIGQNEELVFVTSDFPYELFKDNTNQTWEFGEITDTKNLTNMESMFYGCKNFNADISDWDVSNVTSMKQTFRHCNNFNQPLNEWNASSVTNFWYMLSDCHEFDQPLDKWDTSSATKMDGLFQNCKKFNQDLSQWCVSEFDSQPDYFRFGTPSWTEPKPDWGTCPRGEDTKTASKES